MAGHLVVQGLSRDPEVRSDLTDITLMTRQGLTDQFGFIGLDPLDQPFLRPGPGVGRVEADGDLAGVVGQLTQIARPVMLQ
jgi:hypothetical protein